MSPLSFGTAGLRAPIGPGSEEMNISTVSRTTAGVATWLSQCLRHRPRVAVGYDARYGSHAMARATAEVFAAAGAEVTLIGEPTPTPVLAWLVRDRDYDAGVQITASHNPPNDNGYKLYLAGGSQIISPEDRDIEHYISQQPPHAEAWKIPRSEAVTVDQSALPGYVSALVKLRGIATGRQEDLAWRRQLTVLYTPMHGVGGDALEQALRASGFARVYAVPSQRWPDPTFPTVEFPNPEEPTATRGRCVQLLRQVYLLWS